MHLFSGIIQWLENDSKHENTEIFTKFSIFTQFLSHNLTFSCFYSLQATCVWSLVDAIWAELGQSSAESVIRAPSTSFTSRMQLGTFLQLGNCYFLNILPLSKSVRLKQIVLRVKMRAKLKFLSRSHPKAKLINSWGALPREETNFRRFWALITPIY